MSDLEAPLARLNLPSHVHAQAVKLLRAIAQARTPGDCTRAGDRAEGFVLGLETLRALNAASLEGLYLAFEQAATVRLVMLQ